MRRQRCEWRRQWRRLHALLLRLLLLPVLLLVLLVYEHLLLRMLLLRPGRSGAFAQPPLRSVQPLERAQNAAACERHVAELCGQKENTRKREL